MPNRQLVLRIKDALPKMPIDTRQAIIRRMERDKAKAINGDDFNEILKVIRDIDPERRSFPQRVPTPTRLFFEGIEPFLWDLPDVYKIRGRVPRSALLPIWQWMVGLLPSGTLMVEAERAKFKLAAGDVDAAREQMHQARGEAINQLARVLEDYARRPKWWYEVSMRIDREHTLDHVVDIVDIFSHLKTLSKVRIDEKRITQTGQIIPKTILDALPDDIHALAYAKVTGEIANPGSFAQAFNTAFNFRSSSHGHDHPATAVIDIKTMEAKIAAADLTVMVMSGECSGKTKVWINQLESAITFLAWLKNHPDKPWASALAEPLRRLDDVMNAALERLPDELSDTLVGAETPNNRTGPDKEAARTLLNWADVFPTLEKELGLPQTKRRVVKVRQDLLQTLERSCAGIVQQFLAGSENTVIVEQYFNVALQLIDALDSPKKASAWKKAAQDAKNRDVDKAHV